ncbi:hypothetical protein HTG_11285 [Natrinema mahii]|nr:hypothetical protein HTG_11285 [Natrinema mahii]
MFDAEIEAGVLTHTLEPLEVVTDEIILDLNDGCVTASAADEAQVLMVEVELLPAAFRDYESDGGQIGLGLDKILTILEMSSESSLVNLHLNEEERRVYMEVDGQASGLSLVDLEYISTGPNPPDWELPAKIVIEQSEFRKAIRAANAFGDHLRFNIDKEKEVAEMEARGDSDHTKRMLKETDVVDIEYATIDSKFSLKWLDKISSVIPKDTEVTIEMAHDRPAKISYEIGEGKVEFQLSPRIENN